MTVQLASIQHKDLRKLARLAIKQGWDVEMTGGNHLQWRSPDGSIVHSGSTPSEYRSFLNTKSDLQRAGLIVDERQARRVIKERERADRIRENFSQVDYRFVVEKSLDPDEWFVASKFSDFAFQCLGDALVANAIARPETGPLGMDEIAVDVQLHCQHDDCDFHNNMIIPFLRHQDEVHKESKVDRDIDNPPERERLRCPQPECGFYCWVSQPHILADHLRAEHDLEMCDACKRVMKPDSLQRHIDIHCPVLHPGRRSVRGTKGGGKRAPQPKVDTTFVPDPPRIPNQTHSTHNEQIDADMDAAPSAPVVAPAAPPAPAPAPAPVEVPVAPAADRAVDMTPPSDEDLFAALQMVIGEQVPLNPSTFAKINQWVNLTRELWKEARS